MQKKSDTEILDEVIEWVSKLSLIYGNDFCVDDYAGGNIDDTWYGGFNDGVSYTANDILALIQQCRGE